MKKLMLAERTEDLAKRREKKNHRWMRRVDNGYETFLKYVRRLIKHQNNYGGLRKSTWIKTHFCIRHLNALVRSCKMNFLVPRPSGTGHLQPQRKSNNYFHTGRRRMQAFPNFNQNGNYDNNFPDLLPEAQQPGDPDVPSRFRAGLPGGHGGPGGRNSVGGHRGLFGPLGAGKSECKEAAEVDPFLIHESGFIRGNFCGLYTEALPPYSDKNN